MNFFPKLLLIPILFAFGSILWSGCSEKAEEARFSADEKRSELRRLAAESDLGEWRERVEVPPARASVPPRDFSADPGEELIRQLDSSLASGDNETVLDYLLELEDQGGEVAIRGLGMVIDDALDDDLKLDAIVSLSMMEDGDISAPLLRALEDRSGEVQVAALEVIADLEMANLLPALRVRRGRGGDEETMEALEDTIIELEYLQEADGQD